MRDLNTGSGSDDGMITRRRLMIAGGGAVAGGAGVSAAFPGWIPFIGGEDSGDDQPASDQNTSNQTRSDQPEQSSAEQPDQSQEGNRSQEQDREPQGESITDTNEQNQTQNQSDDDTELDLNRSDDPGRREFVRVNSDVIKVVNDRFGTNRRGARVRVKTRNMSKETLSRVIVKVMFVHDGRQIGKLQTDGTVGMSPGEVWVADISKFGNTYQSASGYRLKIIAKENPN